MKSQKSDMSGIFLNSIILRHLTGVFVCFCLAAFPFKASSDEIHFMTHSSKESTYIDEKGELRGKEHAGSRAFFVELVREMMARMGTSSKIIQDVPLKRGIITVQQRDNYACFFITRTAEREKTVKWVGPLLSNEFYFYEAKKYPTGIKTIGDAKKYTVCVLKGSIYDKPLAEKGFTEIYEVSRYENCLKMLNTGRIPLTVLGDNLFAPSVKNAGLSADDFSQTPVMLFKKEGYIIFSKNISDMEIKKWQAVIDMLKQTGEYDRIYEKYFVVP